MYVTGLLILSSSVGASSQCYWDELRLLKWEEMLVKFELLIANVRLTQNGCKTDKHNWKI